MFSVHRFFISFFVLFSLVDARLATVKRRGNSITLDALVSRREDGDDKATKSIISGWFVGERSDAKDTLKAISWTSYTQMNYAYAQTTANIDKWNIHNEPLLSEFVSLAKDNKVKAGLALGGYDGSRWFSSHVASESNRTALVASVVSLIEKYKLDAIDFGWEFPGTDGIGCNIFSKDDTTNFLSFLKELRKDDTAATITLSASTSLAPFKNSQNVKMSEFSDVLNYITIMDYDIWGFWSPTVGPNAPLASACAPKGSRIGSATSSVKKWTDAGFKSNQIILGLPTYGRAFTVKQTDAFISTDDDALKLYAKYDRSVKTPGDKYDQEKFTGKKDICGRNQAVQGTWTFRNMIEAGFLAEDGKPGENIASKFDNCTQTALVYNESTKIMISYDSADSFIAKAKFVKDKGMGGVALWEQSGDSKDRILMKALLSANSDLSGTVQDPDNADDKSKKAEEDKDKDGDDEDNAKSGDNNVRKGNSSSARVNGPGGLTMSAVFALGIVLAAAYL